MHGFVHKHLHDFNETLNTARAKSASNNTTRNKYKTIIEKGKLLKKK